MWMKKSMGVAKMKNKKNIIKTKKKSNRKKKANSNKKKRITRHR